MCLNVFGEPEYTKKSVEESVKEFDKKLDEAMTRIENGYPPTPPPSDEEVEGRKGWTDYD